MSKNGLMKLDKAVQYLAECRDLDTVVNLRDQSSAVQRLTEVQHRGVAAYNHATEIKVRCERRIAQMVQEIKESGAINTTGGRPKKDGGDRHLSNVLNESGLDQRRVNEWSQLLELSEDEFESEVKKVTSTGGKLSSAAIQKEGQRKKREKKKEKQAREAVKKAAKIAQPEWSVVNHDCTKTLKKLSGVRLVFADPPYNIGIDYGQGKEADRLSQAQYVTWCKRWILAARKTLTDDGAMWVMVCDDYAEHIAIALNECGLHRRAWIKWYETFGVNCSNNFNRCSRHIFYYVVDPKRFVFNTHHKSMQQRSARQDKYNDSRAVKGGKLPDDVWQIPRLTGTSAERLPGFPTQLPVSLLERIIQCSSDPDDLVCDPFCGSGSTGVAAIQGSRRFIGIEKNSQYANKARRRLSGVVPDAASLILSRSK